MTWTPAGPPYLDDAGFLSPVHAATHAVVVQGGYSTPEIEAHRMVADGGTSAERARAWLTANVPDFLSTCNSCEFRPMAAGQEAPSKPGLCDECLHEPKERT